MISKTHENFWLCLRALPAAIQKLARDKFFLFFYRVALPLAAQIILHVVVIARKIKGEHPLLGIKYQPPGQVGAAFKQVFAQFANGNARVGMRIPKASLHLCERGRNLGTPAGLANDVLEPPG